MTAGWKRRWRPIAILAVLMVGWATFIWMAGRCTDPEIKCEHGWLEYWFNWYQTLVTGLPAQSSQLELSERRFSRQRVPRHVGEQRMILLREPCCRWP
jgi:hypothetical protein